jgi:hypothetical protein
MKTKIVIIAGLLDPAEAKAQLLAELGNFAEQLKRLAA